MDNQQERLAELSFVGGLIVGEGCFSLSVRLQQGNRGMIHPQFGMYMVDREAVEFAYNVLKRNVLPGYFDKRIKGKVATRDQYGIRANGMKSLHRLTEGLAPFLMGEKAQAAQIVHDFCAYRLSLGRAAPYSDKDIAFLREIRKVNSVRRTHQFPLEQLPSILRDYTPCPSD